MSRMRRVALVLVGLAVGVLCIPGMASAKWAIEGKTFSELQSEDVNIFATETFTINSKVLGTSFSLTARSVGCSGFCSIDQRGSVDHAEGKLTLSELTVDSPVGCKVNGPITSFGLTGELLMDPGGGSATFMKLFPEGGETLMEVVLTGCAAAGTYPVKGTITGRTNDTAVSAVTQPITFSAAEQTTGGGALKVGKEAATMSGKLRVQLSGLGAGKSWSGA
jgi:hypothetical protein